MTDRRSWFKFYPDDFIGGTVELSAHDTGVYITLLARMYACEGRIKNDPQALSRLCGTTARNFSRALSLLIESGKIIEDGSTLTNKRALQELELSSHFSNVQSEKAKKRWEGQSDKKPNKNNGRSKNQHKPGINSADAAKMPARASPEPETPPIVPPLELDGGKSADYEFAGDIIRVTKADFAKWRENFPHIADLRAELFAHDAFLADRMKPGENWFLRTMNHLRNRNAEAAAKAAEANAEETARAERKRKFDQRRKAYFDADEVCRRIDAQIEALDEAHGSPAHGPERDALCIKLRAAKDERDKFA